MDMNGFTTGYIHVQPNMGWTCPKCGRCFAPTVTECQYCQPVELTPYVQPWDGNGYGYPAEHWYYTYGPSRWGGVGSE